MSEGAYTRSDIKHAFLVAEVAFGTILAFVFVNALSELIVGALRTFVLVEVVADFLFNDGAPVAFRAWIVVSFAPFAHVARLTSTTV